MSTPSQCKRCSKWFVPNKARENVSCTVLHGAGQCCHYSETEVAPPQPTPESHKHIFDLLNSEYGEHFTCKICGYTKKEEDDQPHEGTGDFGIKVTQIGVNLDGTKESPQDWLERYYQMIDNHDVSLTYNSDHHHIVEFIAKEIEDAEQRGYNKREKELVDSMHPAQRRFYEGIPPTNHKDTPV